MTASEPFDPLSGVQAGGPGGSIPFVYGHPDPELFPVDDLRVAADQTLQARGRIALQYGPEQGYGPLIDYLIARIEREEELRLRRENVMITAGAAQGLDMVCRLFCEPGDAIVVEAPTYHEALATMRDYPVTLRQVPCDEAGLIVESLGVFLPEWARASGRPRLLYTVPTFQNPSGITMSLERRQALVELAREHDLWIVEDDVYRDLCYEGRVPSSLYALADGQQVIRLGSFSKILAAGLRLGWLIAPPEAIKRLVSSGLKGNEGGANPFASHVVSTFCQMRLLEPHIACLVARYRERRDALLAALEAHVPEGVTWNRPAGGFFVWLTLPRWLSAFRLLDAARERGVIFAPGPAFFARGGGERHVRLPFSFLPEEALERGVAILAEVVRSLT